ncbi:arrestin 3b, retinal (X-arrestin) isoform X2 [Pangasianodon hypophthalmus]|uniref:arrestin 3b, retinal (X-arrestin) isoform X2 n=1 Tax=Pangasianodon hypophthalmus TaxID=310915 RepID=UPI002307DC55|nr:arrestin 3b, retinal (X-arrestin) isoform X2 [Pangasianodon hypophthalmus]XP_053091698.1 arrestin 3b, retinal (X-arrestin) isoform X2 [Pangasianodon hypophthalmus]
MMAKIYKKNSRNGSICLYLGKRDFVDHVDHVDIVDGVLKVDTSELHGRKVFVQLACFFHYGKEDLDVISLSFRKDIWIQHIQVYPPPAEDKPVSTPMQEVLMKKAGEGAHHFTFNVPTNLPCSVTFLPAAWDKGEACGVDFKIKAYIANKADDPDEKIDKKDTCQMIIRKIQFAPDKLLPGPEVNIYKQFMFSGKTIHLEASIEKEVYYHGEPIQVRVKINNQTSKVVKKIKISINQTADVVLYSTDKYTKVVLCEEFRDQVNGQSTFEKEYIVTPLLANNKEKHGLALDSKLKDEDTNLASSTILQAGMCKDVQGILVSYKIKVNLMVVSGGVLGSLISSHVTAEIPLILMSPKPTGDVYVRY